MSVDKNPKNIGEDILAAGLEGKNFNKETEKLRAELDNVEVSTLAGDVGERGDLQNQFLRELISAEKQYYFWRKGFLIPLMLIVPWLLFMGVWMIFMSEPTTCPIMGMREDPELWTIKNIFVSGSFVTLVAFYLALAKGLFGDKAKDKSLAEKIGDVVQSAKKPDDNS